MIEPPDTGDVGLLRVAALEQSFSKIVSKIDRVDAALMRLEPAVGEIAADNRKRFDEVSLRLAGVEARLAGLDGRFLGVEGRFSSIPSTWQIIGILGALLIGISGIVFSASKFLHP